MKKLSTMALIESKKGRYNLKHMIQKYFNAICNMKPYISSDKRIMKIKLRNI